MMQDIDFDELDRAVNSVTPRGNTSSSDAVTVNTTPLTPPSPSSPSPAARRSSGRFMDVVHPSSDMRGSSSTVPERSAPREEPMPAPSEDKPSTDWPDPLDFHGFNMDDSPVKKEDEPAPAEEKVEEKAEEPAAPTPLETPFLSDAKVEKRPLGAFSTDTPAPSLPEIPTEEPKEEPLLEAPDPEPLLAAENETPSVEPAEPEAKPEPEAEPTPEPEPTPAPVEEAPSNVPTSITQQYKEQPSTGDQPSGAIYDTEAYHQALTHTPKKKSGALVIVWIVALILVGAGAGAAVYFFVLPTL